MKYLYGSAVQGIQRFIFQTNKLREIIGASELVERICTDVFRCLVGAGYHEYDLASGDGSVMHAAGNVKYVFSNKRDCETVFREFPRKVTLFAPGITVSQAVVEFEGDFGEAIEMLESKLRTQRNKPMRSHSLGMIGIERSRQTGLPVVNVKTENRYGKKETLFMDEATNAKRGVNVTDQLCNKAFGYKVKREQLPFDIEEVTGKNDWIAIIHIDGNGLGQVVQKVGHKPDVFRDFSELLDQATKNSANTAFNKLKETNRIDDDSVLPLRPIVLSGDDHTLICRGDIALDYTRFFIEEFENQTHQLLGELLTVYAVFKEGMIRDRLTACAGIAYVKSSYPFYYGYDLAEMLCTEAKRDAKSTIKPGVELPMSCLMFHKVQDSFVEDWNSIRQRELISNGMHSFEFGPYYIHEKPDRTSVSDLLANAKRLHNEGSKDENAVKSALRNWMSHLLDNPEKAKQTMDRIISVLEMNNKQNLLSFVKKIAKPEKRGKYLCYPIYDIMAVNTINTQETKDQL